MPKLYGRSVTVIVEPPNEEGFKVDGHDIAFAIEKTSEPEPNKGNIVIYNLEARLRNRLQLKDDAVVTLKAGYLTTAATIFRGNITHVNSGQQGEDIVTTIEAGEGHKPYRSSFVAKTYGKGTPFKTVVQDIVKTFEGFKVTPSITRIISSIGDSFPAGITLDGPSAKVLTDVLRGTGLAWSIQNGEIQLIETGGASDQPLILLTYETGLVDLPKIGEKKDKATIEFKSFIQPGLFPGRKVSVNWIEGKGEFTCQKVQHKGSNFDDEFYSTVEAAYNR